MFIYLILYCRDSQNVILPPFGTYATGIFYLDKTHHLDSEGKFDKLANELGLKILTWRTVPTNNSTIGQVAKNSEPFMRQVCILRHANISWKSTPAMSLSAVRKTMLLYSFTNLQVFIVPQEGKQFADEELDTLVFMLRKRATHTIHSPGTRFYICSLSVRTVVYKGQLTADQLWSYFVDLTDPLFDTYLALVHTRFSTNTFPSWERAHPLR